MLLTFNRTYQCNIIQYTVGLSIISNLTKSKDAKTVQRPVSFSSFSKVIFLALTVPRCFLLVNITRPTISVS